MVDFGKSESKSESTPTKVDVWNPQQQELFNKLMGVVGGMNAPVSSYPRQMYVDRTPEEQAYFNAINSVYGGGNLDQRVSAINSVLSGKPAYDINPEITEQFYQSAVKAPMMKEWSEVLLPQIKSSYAGPGYWGSARADAETEAATELSQNLASKRAELYYTDEQARRAALESAAGRQATLAGSGTDITQPAISQIGTAGQYARGILQEKVQADLQRWLMGESVDGSFAQQYNPYVQLALAMMGLTPYAIGQQTSSDSDSWNFGLDFGSSSKKGG
jgi:hypothetical protein